MTAEAALRRPATGALDGAEHVYPLRVYYEDTDASGIVYYASYLRMAERARTEMMRLLGAEHARIAATEGVALAVRDCAIEYLAPARLDDVLEIRTRLVAARGASLRLSQVVRRGGRDLARISLRLACVGRTGRTARMPAALREALAPAGLRRSALPQSSPRSKQRA